MQIPKIVKDKIIYEKCQLHPKCKLQRFADRSLIFTDIFEPQICKKKNYDDIHYEKNNRLGEFGI